MCIRFEAHLRDPRGGSREKSVRAGIFGECDEGFVLCHGRIEVEVEVLTPSHGFCAAGVGDAELEVVPDYAVVVAIESDWEYICGDGGVV